MPNLTFYFILFGALRFALLTIQLLQLLVSCSPLSRLVRGAGGEGLSLNNVIEPYNSAASANMGLISNQEP